MELALGRLDPARREALERACLADPALGERARTVRDHLARYDALVDAPSPPPPPYARIAARLQDRAHADRRAARRDAWHRPLWSPIWKPALGLGALAVVLTILSSTLSVFAPKPEHPVATRAFGVAARGVQVRRMGTLLEGRETWLAPGDRLTAHAPAEATLGERVRVVLDTGADLTLTSASRVDLTRGRAFFAVAPGAFAVDTPHGTVQVLGTRFEVSVDGGPGSNGLEVRVEEGTVALGETRIEAGSEWAGHALRTLRGDDVGGWFRRPRLALALPAEAVPGTAVEGALVFVNPTTLAVSVAGPDPVRTSLWLEVETPDGQVLDLPLARVEDPASPLRPGVVLHVRPEASIRVPVRLARAFDEEGVYRCRAMYRPEGRPPLVSEVVTVEVR